MVQHDHRLTPEQEAVRVVNARREKRTMTTFKPGARIRVAAIFRDHANPDQLLDPEIVSLRVMDPQGEERVMTPVRDDEGRYHADVLADIPGRWWWRWEADGGVEDGFFDVSPPNIPEEAERNIERKQAHDKLRHELLKAAKGLGKR